MHTNRIDREHGRAGGRIARIFVVGCVTLPIAACITLKNPPTTEEIRDQSGTLANLALTEPWRAGGQAGPVADNWLATFNDDQLNALVTEAIANNPDLRAGATRVEQAARYVDLAKAQLRPAISFLGTGGVNYGAADPLQLLMLGISWEADLWGRLRYAREAYVATHASAAADFEFARQSLAATVAKSWFTASETYLQSTIAADMVAAAEQLVMLAEQRYDVGIGNDQDVALAQASLGSFQDSAKQIELAHSQALRALELLLGRYPAAEIAARQDLTPLPGPVPAGLPIEMLERRPDMVAAERRIAAAFNRVGEAKAARLPRLTLSANVADIQSDILELQSDFENPAAGAGARLVVPIYGGGAPRTQVEIRTLEQQEAVSLYASLALRALGDVENAIAAGQTLAERDRLLQSTVMFNQRALELTEMNYRVGTTDLRDVQQQQLSLYASRIALLRVQSEQLAQRANLYLAVGGSFEEPPEEQAAAETGPISPAATVAAR
jgi:NodT family efflux transporter outer membrane factor (OMF) lipoprotein